MNDFASTISESVKRIGQTFLVAYYLPAFAFMIVHLYVLIPIWIGAAPPFLAKPTGVGVPLMGNVDLAALIGILLLPILPGAVLAGLNGILIRFFEGKFWWLKWGLLYPFTRLNRKRCEKAYSDLIALQIEYRRASNLLAQAQSTIDRNRIKQQLEGLAQQINEEHKKVEKTYSQQTLPHNVQHIAPTSFGNAYAIAEEYSYERYGIDAVLLWPRLRGLMSDLAPGHVERIAQQKAVVDLSVNLASVSGLLALEAVLTLRLGPGGNDVSLVMLTLLNLALFTCFYRASVGAITALGELIKMSFDYYRETVLKSFDLHMPDDLITEQVVWARLMAFIQRGDEFYFPTESRVSKSNRDRAKKAIDTD